MTQINFNLNMNQLTKNAYLSTLTKSLSVAILNSLTVHPASRDGLLNAQRFIPLPEPVC